MKMTPAKASAILEEFMESKECSICSDERYVDAAFYLIRLGKRVAKQNKEKMNMARGINDLKQRLPWA